MKHSVYDNVLAKGSLFPIARATNSTFNGTAVDRSEFKNYSRAVGVVVVSGVITDGSHVITLEVSDNNTDWTTATTAMGLQGTAPTLISTSDNVVLEFGYVGPERYLRVVSTTTGITSGGIYGATVLLSDPRRKPVARA